MAVLSLSARPRLYAGPHGNHNLVHVYAALGVKRLGQRNAFIEPLGQSVTVNSANARPLRKRVCHPVKSEVSAIAAIILLIGAGSPTAIFWAVTAVIVNPLQSVIRRAFAHIGKKILKHLPTVANQNAAPAVMMKRRIFGILASLTHGKPRLVNARSGMPMREVVGAHMSGTSAGLPPALTSAGNDFSSSEVACTNGLDCAAITLTNPISARVFMLLHNSQIAKALSSQIHQFSHKRGVALNGAGVKV